MEKKNVDDQQKLFNPNPKGEFSLLLGSTWCVGGACMYFNESHKNV